MDKEFYEATRPSLNQKLKKEGNFFTRFLARHPRLIIPLLLGGWVLMFAAMTPLVLFVN